ncbi:MAG: class I SAM-dependent methyltransferase [Pseudomonadota bacterium]
MAEAQKKTQRKTWSAADYAENARFVPTLAGPVLLDMLAAKPGERILDLGCGDGALTVQIAETGADVLGVDGDGNMVAAAVAMGVTAQCVDGQALSFENEFDAVFTNAALHWMLDAPAVAAGVFKALKPGGRYVGEFGGFGNIAAVQAAARAVMQARGFALPGALPHYYPTDEDYTALLEQAGFATVNASLIPRPTPLPTGLIGWLETFGDSLLPGVPDDQHASMFEEMCTLLKPCLCTPGGTWFADYIRLRFTAEKPGP